MSREEDKEKTWVKTGDYFCVVHNLKLVKLAGTIEVIENYIPGVKSGALSAEFNTLWNTIKSSAQLLDRAADSIKSKTVFTEERISQEFLQAAIKKSLKGIESHAGVHGQELWVLAAQRNYKALPLAVRRAILEEMKRFGWDDSEYNAVSQSVHFLKVANSLVNNQVFPSLHNSDSLVACIKKLVLDGKFDVKPWVERFFKELEDTSQLVLSAKEIKIQVPILGRSQAISKNNGTAVPLNWEELYENGQKFEGFDPKEFKQNVYALQVLGRKEKLPFAFFVLTEFLVDNGQSDLKVRVGLKKDELKVFEESERYMAQKCYAIADTSGAFVGSTGQWGSDLGGAKIFESEKKALNYAKDVPASAIVEVEIIPKAIMSRKPGFNSPKLEGAFAAIEAQQIQDILSRASMEQINEQLRSLGISQEKIDALWSTHNPSAVPEKSPEPVRKNRI